VSKSFDGQILHFGNVRYRVTGNGILRSSLISTDDVNTVTLPTITMTAATNKQPTILANMNEQQACLKGETTDINETFEISKMTVFIRPVATGYPQF
jgi:hypothetical protein